MKLTEQDKRRIIAFDVGGWDVHEIAVDFLWRKYPIEYALVRKSIQICLEEKKNENRRQNI